ncbi:MAG TPA: outer membrane beta-barrel protein [Lentimicrobium sp.]|jgi:hypothetical protein|nr:outer membrane beta-barrel protein [Lentimicrobium sp.]
MKNKILLVIVFFAFLADRSFSQSDFRDGFIITLENDTIKGLVDYRSNLKNYKSCVFLGEREERKYHPHEINGFGYDNDKFYASQILEGSFVEVLVTGDISLYKSKEKYHVKKDADIYDLASFREEVKIDRKVYVRDNNKWRGILSILIGDCLNNTNDVVSKINLNERSLTTLIVGYNQCKGSEYKEFKAGKPWIKYDFGAATGLARSEIQVIYSSTYYNYLADSYSSVDPSVGALFSISSPRITEKIEVQGEIHFIKSAYSSLIVLNKSSTEYHDTYIDLTTLSMPLSLKYSFPEKKYGLYVQAGINLDYHLKTESRRMTEIVTGNVVNTYPESPAVEINNYQTGYWGGIGILKSYPKFKAGIAVRYFDMSTLNSAGLFMAKSNRVTLNLFLIRK